MKKPSDKKVIIVAAVYFAITVSCGLALLIKQWINSFEAPEHLRCAIELRENLYDGLLTGYNYKLLSDYADTLGCTLDIAISRKGESYLDSLKNGSIDILVVPFSDSVSTDSLLSSIPVDSISLWLLPYGYDALLAHLNDWIDKYHCSDTYDETRNRYLKSYDPLKRAMAGKKSTVLSPYDDIIKANAETIGWDWRMLAAVIFQESYFRIDARSYRGAIGLMQVMPNTAENLDSNDLIKPDVNIEAGTKYLGMLSKRYRRAAADKKEQMKFTLAAYNAGAGRMKDILGYASFKGVNTGVWEDIKAIIPEMNNGELMEALDTVKLGKFKGEETILYVDRVFDLYDAFCKICPEK